MDLKSKLVDHFREASSAPFLFVGSGFSRRYLNLPDWERLLRMFAANLRPFEYYLSTANENLAEAASLMAPDFHSLWWSSPEYEASREKNRNRTKDRTSALRIEICNYLNGLSFPDVATSPYREEIEAFSRLNVDGIITTNWDGLLERFFPDYKVFVGQNELLFSNPQSIAEIYKIHGSASRPSSLVLTKEDYDDFEAKNPYLAAKLITLFVEHPIVFLGYSLTDKNISGLLHSIVSVLGTDKLDKLRNNLIFITRSENEVPEYSQTFMAIDGRQIPITIVKAKSYVPIYEALDEVKRRIPARVLRYCKEQLYELVKSSSPDAKLRVVDIDEIDRREDVEFVVGVGVANQMAADLGYQAISPLKLFEDLIVADQSFDADRILRRSLPVIGRCAKFVPVFKYLAANSVNSREAADREGIDVRHHLPKNLTHYRTPNYAKPFVRTEKHKSAQEIIDSNPPEKAAAFLAFLSRDKLDLAVVKDFLRANFSKFDSSASSYATLFRKLACLYDLLEYGEGFIPEDNN